MINDFKLSVIIPVFNNWSYTKNCIDKLSLLKFLQVIVIDNLSNDETKVEMTKLTNKNNNIVYFRNNKNKGFAAAVNKGISLATSHNIMILNNDIIFNEKYEDWFENLINVIQENHLTLIGPTGGYVNPNNEFNFLYETSDKNKNINYMSGWCLAAQRETWKKLNVDDTGPFDEKTFFLYYEDTDLGFRASQLNIKFKLIDCPLKHIGKQTSKLIGVSKYYEQSRYRFIKKWKK